MGDAHRAGRIEWLRGRLAAGTLSRARLELVAKLGDVEAAAALGVAPVTAGALDLYVRGGVLANLDAPEGVLALAHAVEGVVRWWRREALAEPRFLEPIAQALEAATSWAAGPDAARGARALEAARHLDRVILVIAFEGGGGGADRATHERAFNHLARAAVSVAYVAAPPGEPLRVATPWEPVVERSRKNERGEREDRLRGARDHVDEAIAGRAYLENAPRRSDDGDAVAVGERARALRAELQRTLAARLLV